MPSSQLSWACVVLLIFLIGVEGAHVSRIVVTLNEYNACDVELSNFTKCVSVAKCYGRRLVLSVGGCDPSTDWEMWARDELGAENVAMVEEDAAFSVAELNYTITDETVVIDMNSSMILDESGKGNNNLTLPNLDQWNLRAIDIYNLWVKHASRGENYTVAVLDSGMSVSALDAFGDRVVPGYDFVSDKELSKDGDGRDADYYDPGDADAEYCPGSAHSWHGTKVSSVLAAEYQGFTGVAPESKIMPVRVLGRCGTGYASDVADGIVWAAGGPIIGLDSASVQTENRIIVMALSGRGKCLSFMQTAVDLAVSKNVKLFAAAGNEPNLQASDHFPANCKGVVSVGALNARGEIASYSSKNADVYMPGGDFDRGVQCLDGELNMQRCVGTSIAVPHAAGLRAVVEGVRESMLDAATEKANTSYTSSNETKAAGTVFAIPPAYYSTCTSATRAVTGVITGTYEFSASTSSVPSVVPPGCAFDSDVNTYWSPKSGIYWGSNGLYGPGETAQLAGDGYKGEWIALKIPAKVLLRTFYVERGSVNDNTVPKAYRLYARKNEVPTWSMIADVTNAAYGGSTRMHILTLASNTPACDWVALAVSQTLGNTNLNIRNMWYEGELAPPECPAGQYWSGTACTVCPTGSYSSQVGSTACTLCPAGTFAATTNSTSCSPCPAGTYSTATGLTSNASCTPCPAGTFSTATGASLASTCQACGAGLTSAAGSTSCGCVAGFYGSISAQGVYPSAAMTACSSTVGGRVYKVKYYSSYGGNNWKAFDKVTDGTVEYFSYPSFSSTTGVSTGSNPFFGTDSSFPGDWLAIDMGGPFKLTSYKIHFDSRYVGMAPATWTIYGTSDSSRWLDSPSCCLTYPLVPCDGLQYTGDWKTLDTETSQLSYPSGTQFFPTSTNAELTRFLVLHVNRIRTASRQSWYTSEWEIFGYYSECLACPSGTYSTAIGATNSSTCQLCPVGTFSTSGSTNCTLCPAGFFSSTPGSSTCSPCPAGTFSSAVGATSNASCSACPAGFFSAPNSTTCTICPAGSYSFIPEPPCTLTTTFSYTPVLAMSTAMHSHSRCFVLSSGNMKCYGNNYEGELGYGDQTFDKHGAMGNDRPYVNVGGLVESVANGELHTCAILVGGVLKCWGQSNYYELGYGSTQLLDTPPQAGVNLGPGLTAKMVSLSKYFTCVILNTNNVKCWGYGEFGQLGYGDSVTYQTVPAGTVDVGGEPVKQISSGLFHVCALLSTSNSIKCWGDNRAGQLGYGDYSNRPAPIASTVSLGSSALEVCCGRFHTCALLSDGTVKCWGSNTNGQLGYGDTTLRNAPEATAAVLLGGSAIDISCGYSHTCAVLSSGVVKCWGQGTNGRIGNGDTSGANVLSPATVSLVGKAKSVSCGYTTTCVLMLDDSSLRCWGQNNMNQLGWSYNDPMYAPDTAPVNIESTSTTTCVAQSAVTTGNSACTLCPGGMYSTATGATNSSVCMACPAGSFSAPGSTSCTPCPAGTFAASNSSSACASCPAGYFSSTPGSTSCTPCPQGTFSSTTSSTACTGCPAETFSNASAATSNATCAKCPNGTRSLAASASCTASFGSANLPAGYISSSSSGSSACALTEASVLKCWGYNARGQLGINSTANMGDGPGEMGDALPAVVLASSPSITVTKVSAGTSHTCAILSNGGLKCWGFNGMGQLGLNHTSDWGKGANQMGDNLPYTYLGRDAVPNQVSCGSWHTCAVLANSQVKCWGEGNGGKLGTGNINNLGDGPGEMGDNLLAVDVGPGLGVKSVSCSDSYTCAILTNNRVKCWGYNNKGQLGINNTNTMADGPGEMGNSLPYVELGYNRTVLQIETGISFNCALLDNFQVKCWGDNWAGQLGINNTNNMGDGGLTEMGEYLPYVALGTGRTVKQITVGYSFACALLENSQIKCWGDNWAGQLGIGNTTKKGDGPNEMGDLLPYVSLGTGRTARQVAAQGSSVCALLDNGEIKCWGAGGSGSLGNGAIANVGDQPNQMGDSLVPASLGTFLCFTCPSGTFTVTACTQTAAATCATCPVGTYSQLQGAFACVQCPVGTFSNTTGATSNSTCQSCAAGLYAPNAGMQGCLSCGAGSFSFAGSAGCSPCPAGTWSGTSGTAACTYCPLGTFLNTTGATSESQCMQCPPGTFGNATGLTRCFACGEGRYAAGPGATSCSLCPRGTSTKKV